MYRRMLMRERVLMWLVAQLERKLDALSNREWERKRLSTQLTLTREYAGVVVPITRSKG